TIGESYRCEVYVADDSRFFRRIRAKSFTGEKRLRAGFSGVCGNARDRSLSTVRTDAGEHADAAACHLRCRLARFDRRGHPFVTQAYRTMGGFFPTAREPTLTARRCHHLDLRHTGNRSGGVVPDSRADAQPDVRVFPD